MEGQGFRELTVSGEVPVIPAGRPSAVAVDLRRVVQIAGRLIQEKVRKECPCVVSTFCKVYDIARRG